MKKRLGILMGDCYPENFWTPASEWYELVDLSAFKSWTPELMLEKLRSVDVAVTGRASPPLPLALAGNFGRLKLLCHLHGTIRHLVPKALIEAGLTVTNWGDAVAGVAEGAMALLLACLKQLAELDHWTRTHEDRRIYQMFPCTLHGTPVGLYGYGPIGRHMARMLMPFGPKIAIYDPYAKDVPPEIRVCPSLRELFATCPIISIHCGLNEATENSVNAELLDLLPQGGILINTARGGVVVEQDLADALNAGRLCAGIDVIADERGGDAWQRSPLAKAKNTILTHHRIGGGRGYPPGKAPAPTMPDFLRHNLQAFAAGGGLINAIPAEIYDLKT